MSVEKITAKRLAEKGMALLDRILTDFEDMPPKQLLGHTKNITDAVLACTKVQAEEREQLDFEKENQLSPEDIRAAFVGWLRSMPLEEKQQLMVETGLAPPLSPPPSQEDQPHA